MIKNEKKECSLKYSAVKSDIKLFTVDSVDSTNRLAKDFARGIKDSALPEGACYDKEQRYLFIAREQTAGKGRLDRRFLSERGVGLYMSFLFTPDVTPSELTTLTAYAAVCTASAIERLCGADVKIKWVNDMIIRGKKAAGILTEASLSSDGVAYAIIGIGINLKKQNFGELSEIATSLEDSCGYSPAPEELALLISEQLSEFATADRSAYMNEYKKRSTVIGKNIKVIPTVGNPYEALAIDIADSGELIIENEQGVRTTLSAADVSVRPCAKVPKH